MSKQSDPYEWLRFAHDDLSAARLLLTDVELPARMACFHAQQAAEKALMASLVHSAIQFRKTHDLVVLVALQPEPIRSEVGNLDLQRLQQWAVDARYPADLPDITARRGRRGCRHRRPDRRGHWRCPASERPGLTLCLDELAEQRLDWLDLGAMPFS